MELIRLITAAVAHMFMHGQTSMRSGPKFARRDAQSLKCGLASGRIPALQHVYCITLMTTYEYS